MDYDVLNELPTNPLQSLQEAALHLVNQRALYIENPENLDWVILEPVFHFLSPVLFLLHKKKQIVLPENFLQQAENIYFSNKGRWIILEHRLKQILHTLYKADIEVIPLKGAILQSLIYQDNGLRAMADIDILVRPEKFLHAATLLSQIGLQLAQRNDLSLEKLAQLAASNLPGELSFFDGRGFGIDLHQSLMPSKWFSAVYDVNMEAVWARSISLSEQQQATMAAGDGLWKTLLSPYDMLAHLCLHSALHGLQNTKSYLDVDLWVRNAPVSWDWDSFIEIANQWHIRSAVYHMLVICTKLLGTSVPVEVPARINPGWLARWRVGWLISAKSLLSGRPSLGDRYPTLVKLALADSLVRMFVALFRVAFPESAMVSRHPSQGGLLGHWLHVIEVVKRGD